MAILFSWMKGFPGTRVAVGSRFCKHYFLPCNRLSNGADASVREENSILLFVFHVWVLQEIISLKQSANEWDLIVADPRKTTDQSLDNGYQDVVCTE